MQRCDSAFDGDPCIHDCTASLRVSSVCSLSCTAAVSGRLCTAMLRLKKSFVYYCSSWASGKCVQVTDDLRQQLASANLKAEQVQGELTSQQRSSETSVEALAIEHKCTKDKLQVHACTVYLKKLHCVSEEAATLPRPQLPSLDLIRKANALLALSYTLNIWQLPSSVSSMRACECLVASSPPVPLCCFACSERCNQTCMILCFPPCP